MATASVHLKLSDEVLKWLPLVAAANRDVKGKPDPLAVEAWCFRRLRDMVSRYGGIVNRLMAKGYVLVRTGEAENTRVEARDLQPAAFHPKEATEGENFVLSVPVPYMERVECVVALLHLYQEKGITHDEKFGTLEEWATTFITETVADAYTALQAREDDALDLPFARSK
ncbi:MAG: hypothetical protein B7Z78_13415 [Rhodospirillales bacterium 20-60-12]|nr:MAG: hypothetical protein B7Z78_13415 [Rhodospirillales bacterium 20-60-12]